MEKRTKGFENYLHNLSLDPAHLRAEAAWGTRLAEDEKGFLTDQNLLDDYKMSRVNSARYGCGWVACCNALRLLDRPESPARVIRSLEKWFVLGGKMGTHALAVPAFFGKRGYRVRLSVLPGQLRKTAQSAPANILFYIRGPKRGGHFVAFAPAGREKEGEPLFCFYNSQSVRDGARKPPAGETGRFFCAGGNKDERTLTEVLKKERPVLVWVFSIYKENRVK